MIRGWKHTVTTCKRPRWEVRQTCRCVRGALIACQEYQGILPVINLRPWHVFYRQLNFLWLFAVKLSREGRNPASTLFETHTHTHTQRTRWNIDGPAAHLSTYWTQSLSFQGLCSSPTTFKMAPIFTSVGASPEGLTPRPSPPPFHHSFEIIPNYSTYICSAPQPPS